MGKKNKKHWYSDTKWIITTAIVLVGALGYNYFERVKVVKRNIVLEEKCDPDLYAKYYNIQKIVKEQDDDLIKLQKQIQNGATMPKVLGSFEGWRRVVDSQRIFLDKLKDTTVTGIWEELERSSQKINPEAVGFK
ncbi:hypothetical protein QWY87_13620 [Lutimonas halocynthiae]|uniref:hypothetical protein n=1 Tax=Lutimonas halocynthiae TaxID=1446477 RepID=UPI0025B4BE9C|nr:hypothetical protein [Lutimonas halocynthiae]MDN3643750.1 hypothetical protein [Lutimonas halocynthiae]